MEKCFGLSEPRAAMVFQPKYATQSSLFAKGGYNGAMDTQDAHETLAGQELIPCLQATLSEAKELRDACLAAEIPVVLDRGACCGKGGCGCAPKMQLLARAGDLPRINHLVHERWRELALREGTVGADHPAVAASETEDPPCPACGTAAPLVQGACIDCGLQLE
jgi:hypothetical protein